MQLLLQPLQQHLLLGHLLSQRVSSKPPSPDGRDCNVILFGLPESRSIVDSVDEMLGFLAGKPIPVKDVFRPGKYGSKGALSSHRPHPVLVKPTTLWDRKLILVRKSNLRTFKVPHLFLREDVPPDHKLLVKIPTKGAGQSPSTNAPPVCAVKLREFLLSLGSRLIPHRVITLIQVWLPQALTRILSSLVIPLLMLPLLLFLLMALPLLLNFFLWYHCSG